MIRNVNKLLRKVTINKNPPQKQQQKVKQQESPLQSFSQNVETICSIYNNCSDVVFHGFLIFGKIKAMLIYIEGLSDNEGINDYILTPLTTREAANDFSVSESIESAISVSKIDKVHVLEDCIEALSTGNPILLYDGAFTAYSLGLAKWEKRSVEEPEAEAVISGPREGFTEALQVNTYQLRRIIGSR